MSQILPHKVERIETPYVIACEGYNDVCLVDKLLEQRRITKCGVGCPSRTGIGGDGKDFLARYVSALDFAARKDEQRALRGILVMVDADENPSKAFASACNALSFARFPIPDSAFTLKEENGVRAAVYVVPGERETGTLEHLLFQSAIEMKPESEPCVDAFLACIGRITTEKPNAIAKMKMSALIAASFPSNPWATPGLVLQSRQNDLIPLGSEHFKHLGDFLANFCAD